MKTSVYGYDCSFGTDRYIGKTTQKAFIEAIISDSGNQYSKNWIKDRLAETGNLEELKIAVACAGSVVLITDDYKIVRYLDSNKEVK